ncbi:hypothetical protein QF049_000458 [Paenibacillus sp. W4I10]|nr:hypothetical protein [Paenibacillus sp. W4I10]
MRFPQILVFVNQTYRGGFRVLIDGVFYELWAECSISCLLPSA